jgi:soluble P-type ATPase
MLTLSIPGFNNNIQLQHLVLDFNGTLAIDGKLIPGVKGRLTAISKILSVHVVTGNSFGTAEQELKGIPCKTVLISANNQGTQKRRYVAKLNPETVIGIGNGNNDYFLLKESAIGIIVIQKEGASARSLSVADIVCPSIIDALDLIKNPIRLKATLRN